MLDEHERRNIFSFFKLCRDEKTVKSWNYDIDIGTVCLCRLLMSAENFLGLNGHSHADDNAVFFPLWRSSPQWARASSFTRFLDHTQRRATVGRTPLNEWSARRRDLYLTTQHSQQTDIHAPGGIRTHNLSRRAAADVRLRPRGHWDRR